MAIVLLLAFQKWLIMHFGKPEKTNTSWQHQVN